MLGAGLEPACLSAYAPQTYVSAIPPPERLAKPQGFERSKIVDSSSGRKRFPAPPACWTRDGALGFSTERFVLDLSYRSAPCLVFVTGARSALRLSQGERKMSSSALEEGWIKVDLHIHTV